MFGVGHELQQRWGSGSDISSLAVLVLLGRCGIGRAGTPIVPLAVV
jgi:hypothetical protein